jgi:hypothetical protein
LNHEDEWTDGKGRGRKDKTRHADFAEVRLWNSPTLFKGTASVQDVTRLTCPSLPRRHVRAERKETLHMSTLGFSETASLMPFVCGEQTKRPRNDLALLPFRSSYLQTRAQDL